MNQFLIFFGFFLLSSFIYLNAQERSSPDLLHNHHLYFSRLPENSKTLVSQYLFKHFFPRFTRGAGEYEKALQKIEYLSHINCSFLNTVDTTSHLFDHLFFANPSNQISCLDILFWLQARFPSADNEKIINKAIQCLQIRCYTPQEIQNGLQAKHFRTTQEYLARRESQRISNLYLSASELATWKLIQLMKPSFDKEHRNPLEIESQKKKDMLIAPQVAHLLAQGAYPKAYCYKSYSLLVCAAAWRMARTVELLLNAGVDPNEGPIVPLWHAKGGKITKLLLFKGADPNDKTKSGHVPLMPLYGYSSVAKVHLLLEAGANPNAVQTSDYPGFTPLIHYLHRLTKEANRLPIVEALLSAGADPSIRLKSYRQETATDIARRCGMDNIVALLTRWPQKIA